METFIQLLTDWGYIGLFLSAFIAGSILPFSSEVVMVVLIGMGANPVLCIIAAAVGNTLGGMTCYWIGMAGRKEWITRYLGIKQSNLDKATAFLGGRGALMGFFAFLPYIGEAIAIVLGLMRSNQLLAAVAMFIGKAARYVAIYYIYKFAAEPLISGVL